jgi:hypothetical protein
MWGTKKPWRFMDKVYQNIVIRKRGKGYEIGLDKRATTRHVGFGGKKGKCIKVETYASYVEFGTDHIEARPLFTPVLNHFHERHIPGLDKIAQKGMLRVMKRFTRAKIQKARDTAPVDAFMSEHSSRSAGVGRGDFDYHRVQAEIDGKTGAGGLSKTKYHGKQTIIRKPKQEDDRDLKTHVKHTCGEDNAAAIQRILDSDVTAEGQQFLWDDDLTEG